MSRPTREELVKRFFPELGETGSHGETQAAIEINTRACEAILADQIKLFDDFFSVRGPGALCLKLADGDRHSHYVTLDDFCADLLDAEANAHPAMSAFLKDTISTIKNADFEKEAMILLIDKSHISLLPLSREYPAKAVQRLQEEVTI